MQSRRRNDKHSLVRVSIILVRDGGEAAVEDK